MKQSKRVRKSERARRRTFGMSAYRRECRETIGSMRHRNAPVSEFRATLKALRHDFARAVAGRGAA